MSVIASARAALTHTRREEADESWISRWLPVLLVLLLTVVVGFLVLYPLVMLLLGSFAPPRGVTAAFSLEGYRTAFEDVDARKAMLTTLWLSLVRAALAVLVAVFLAWAISRTNVPGRAIFHNLIILGFFMPLLPQIVAWSLLLSTRTGTLNVLLRNALGIDSGTGPFNIYSYEGIIFLGVLGWSGFLYLFISPAFQGVDAALEEAAKMSGANSFQTLWRVSMPLLKPALLGAFSLAFVRMVESFETELFLGVPARIYVFTTQIYSYLSLEVTPNYPPAIALSTVLIVLTLVIITLQVKLLGNRSYVTITGKNFRRTPADFGRWKYLLFAILVFYIGIHTVLPLGMLILSSVQRTTAQFRMDAFTLDHWKVLGSSDVWQSVRNTLVAGFVSATVGLVLVSLISYIVNRTKLPFRRLLDGFTWVPYMVPSFILGVGFLWAVLKGIPLPFTLYGSLTLLMIAFVVRVLPLGARLMNGTMVQLSNELEESARMSGASWTQTFRRVVMPLLRPALVIGWLMFMVTIVRDLSTVVLLYGPASQVLSVTFYAHWKAGTPEDAAVIGLLMTFIGLALGASVYVLQRRTGHEAAGIL